jgi:NAD(P)-dependent dehydrogenase (short-subunit alcohol dehydrogenase family)
MVSVDANDMARTNTTRVTFAGGVAVITGAGSGIGAALAHAAARLPMKVVVADISRERAAEVVKSIHAEGGVALAVVADVADPATLDRLAAIAHENYGDVRLLINNAGIETVGFCWEIPAERWEQTLRINIHGVVHGVRAFVPRMIACGQPAFVVNMASIAAVSMGALQGPYLMSKHAVLSFSESLLLDLQVKGAPIKVSAVLPGPVATRVFQDAQASAANPMAAHHRTAMHDLLTQYGISAEAAADSILDQVAAGQFWVTTHPDMLRTFAAQRAT